MKVSGWKKKIKACLRKKRKPSTLLSVMVELTWLNPEGLDSNSITRLGNVTGQVSPTRSGIQPIVRDPFLYVGIFNAPSRPSLAG
jgi:hypothetical protein